MGIYTWSPPLPRLQRPSSENDPVQLPSTNQVSSLAAPKMAPCALIWKMANGYENFDCDPLPSGLINE